RGAIGGEFAPIIASFICSFSLPQVARPTKRGITVVARFSLRVLLRGAALTALLVPFLAAPARAGDNSLQRHIAWLSGEGMARRVSHGGVPTTTAAVLAASAVAE